MRTTANAKTNPSMTKFVKFFHLFVGPYQVTKNRLGLGTTIR